MTASDGECSWMQQTYGQTYVEQFLHKIVELLCATGNNGHSAQVYIDFLIMCLLSILELFTSNYLTMHGSF